jgi:adenylate cyclase
MARDDIERRLAAILSADVVGYGRLMAEDEVETVRTLEAYRELAKTVVGEHRGQVIDSPGDNLVAEFPSALDAVRAGIEIQRVLAARNSIVPEARRMQYRIGIHLGDVMVEGERIYGEGLNVAARLEELAGPGGVCLSEIVRGQVRNEVDVDLSDLGPQTLENIPEPVRAFRLQPGTPPRLVEGRKAGFKE